MKLERWNRLLRILLQEAVFMCKRAGTIGYFLMALGAGLLLSMLVPRCGFTVLVAALLILLGWLVRR